MRNKLSVAALAMAALMTACNSSDTTSTTRIELPGTVDAEAFAANVESVSVLNLEMDDDWAFVNYPWMAFGDNYVYLLEGVQSRLSCFDRQTGEKLAARTIKGNGPGEFMYINAMFCNGDTLCVTDEKGNILQYDHKITFLGKLHELGEELSHYKVMPFGSKNYALVTTDGGSDQPVLVTDRQFNIVARHFPVQETKRTLSSGVAESIYTKGDTVRGFLASDNRIFTLYGETEGYIELVVPNPLPLEVMQQVISHAVDFKTVYEYDGLFGNLVESGRFISFVYNFDGKRHTSLLDKHTKNVVSIPADGGNSNNTAGVFADFFNKTTIFMTDGEFIYAKAPNARIAELIEGHDDALDERLKKTQAEYRAYLEHNADYLKGLEPEERNAATVLLKIKLKD